MTAKAGLATTPEKQALVEIGIGAAYLVAGAGAVHVVELVMTLQPVGKALLGAVAMDLLARRAGVDLDVRRVPRSIGIGFGLALIVVTIVIGASAALGWAQIAAGAPSITLLFGVLRAVALGWRDELLLRAIPLHAAKRARVPDSIALVFAALTGAFSLAASDLASPPAFALAIALGWGFALICKRFGPFTAIAAHGALAFLLGPGTRGALVDVTWTGTLSFALGSRAAGPIAWLATGVVLAVALGGAFLARRGVARDGGARGSVL